MSLTRTGVCDADCTTEGDRDCRELRRQGGAQQRCRSQEWPGTNQALCARTRRVEIYDDALDATSERLAWDALGWIDEYLPPSAAGKEIVSLLHAGKYASALERYFAAKDAGVELTDDEEI